MSGVESHARTPTHTPALPIDTVVSLVTLHWELVLEWERVQSKAKTPIASSSIFWSICPGSALHTVCPGLLYTSRRGQRLSLGNESVASLLFLVTDPWSSSAVQNKISM